MQRVNGKYFRYFSIKKFVVELNGEASNQYTALKKIKDTPNFIVMKQERIFFVGIAGNAYCMGESFQDYS